MFGIEAVRDTGVIINFDVAGVLLFPTGDGVVNSLGTPR